MSVRVFTEGSHIRMKKNLTMRFAHIICALVGILLGIVAITMSKHFKQFTNVPVGPEVFPQIMAYGLIICSLVLLVQSIFKKTNEKAPTLSPKDKGIQYMLLTVAVVVLIYLLWDIAGFLIVGSFSLFSLMWIADYRNYKNMIIISLITTVLIWLIFWQVLVIELPLGPFDTLFY